jgi:hypothetical protein
MRKTALRKAATENDIGNKRVRTTVKLIANPDSQLTKPKSLSRPFLARVSLPVSQRMRLGTTPFPPACAHLRLSEAYQYQDRSDSTPRRRCRSRGQSRYRSKGQETRGTCCEWDGWGWRCDWSSEEAEGSSARGGVVWFK